MEHKGDPVIQEKKNENLYLISRNFKEKWSNYIWQSAAAGIVTFSFLFIYYELISLVVIAGVGSTFFTVFATPKLRTAQTRNVIGSYVICVLLGMACFTLSPVALSGGVAVGAAAFLMVITDTEHPPAAGVALGLSITSKTEYLYAGAIFAVLGALVAASLKHLLLPLLKDLT